MSKADELKKEAEDYQFNYPKIKELEQTNNKLLDVINNQDVKIAELEQENAILKGRTEGFEKQILGLLYKYESVYKRFPDLKDAMNEAERVLKENAELKSVYQDLSDKFDFQVKQVMKLEKENAYLKERYDRVDIIGYDALKNLTKAKERIRALLFHLTDDTFYVTYETQKQSVERARQFLRGIGK